MKWIAPTPHRDVATVFHGMQTSPADQWETAESPLPSRVYSVGQGCVCALYCVTQPGKEECLCPGVQGRTSLVDLLLDIPLGAGLVLSAKQEGTAQQLHSSGKVLLYTPCEPWKQAEMSNRNMGENACNRAWWKLKAMEYFTSALFSHLLSTIPWLMKNIEKKLSWPSGIPSTLGIWEAAEQCVLVRCCHCWTPEWEAAIVTALSSLSQNQLHVSQCPFFSWDPSPKPPVFKETEEQQRSQTHSSSKMPTPI